MERSAGKPASGIEATGPALGNSACRTNPLVTARPTRDHISRPPALTAGNHALDALVMARVCFLRRHIKDE